jgi:hypothetical protein
MYQNSSSSKPYQSRTPQIDPILNITTKKIKSPLNLKLPLSSHYEHRQQHIKHTKVTTTSSDRNIFSELSLEFVIKGATTK